MDTSTKDLPGRIRAIAFSLVIRLSAQFEVEDLIQVGMLTLVQAERTYDPNRGATFYTYAYPRIYGAMVDSIRKELPNSRYRLARKETMQQRSFVQMSSLEADTLYALRGEDKDIFRSERLRRALKTLSKHELQILVGRFAHDMLFREISRGIGMPTTTVCLHHTKALAKLKELLTA